MELSLARGNPTDRTYSYWKHKTEPASDHLTQTDHIDQSINWHQKDKQNWIEPTAPFDLDPTYDSIEADGNSINQLRNARLVDARDHTIAIHHLAPTDQTDQLASTSTSAHTIRDYMEQLNWTDHKDEIERPDFALTEMTSTDSIFSYERSVSEQLDRRLPRMETNRTLQEDRPDLISLAHDYQWIADALLEQRRQDINQTYLMDYNDMMLNRSKDIGQRALVSHLVDRIEPPMLTDWLDSDRRIQPMQSHHKYSAASTTSADDVQIKDELHKATLIVGLVVFGCILLCIIIIIGMCAMHKKIKAPIGRWYEEYFV